VSGRFCPGREGEEEREEEDVGDVRDADEEEEYDDPEELGTPYCNAALRLYARR